MTTLIPYMNSSSMLSLLGGILASLSAAWFSLGTLAEPGCDRRHNTTAWLTQAYLLLEDVRAGESMAKASHLCALICGRDDLYSCAQGPGVAAAWLVMRTMGLARPPHAGGGTRSGRAGTRVSSTSR